MKFISEQETLRRLHQAVAQYETQKAAAHAWKISEQYLCDLLKGRRPIADSIARAALNLESVRHFKPVKEEA